MNFLTTKQIAEVWQITPKRVTVLAGQGRIPGAKRVDGRWFIPEDAAKPTDPRKQKASASADEPYLFPFPLCIVTSPEQVDGFTPEQKELYRLNIFFEQGSFPEARELAEKLLPSKNRYIRIGALYLLPLICLSLHDFPAMEHYSALFHDLCESETEHKADIDTLLIELDGETASFSEFMEEIDNLDIRNCSQEILPFISAYKLLALASKYRVDGVRPDVSLYEALCRMLETQGCFYNLIFIHFYLSLYYSLAKEKELEVEHLKAALDIALEHDTIFTLSFLSFVIQGTLKQALKDYPDEYAERIDMLCRGNIESRAAYAIYQGKKALFAQLDDGDSKLLSFCLGNYSIEQMAEEFGLSRSGINKRLYRLYSKLGVSSKKELGEKFVDSALDWK